MMDARHVKLVMAIGQHGSLVRAGRVLGMSPSALTRALAALESKLNAQLFERSRRGMTPTAIGRAVLAKGGDVLRATEELSLMLAELRGEHRETLWVSAGPFAMEAVVAGAAARFLAQEPRVQLRLEAGTAAAAVRRVLDRRSTLAVAEISDLEAADELEVTPLRRHPLLLVVRPGHALAAPGRDPGPADVFRHPCIVPPQMASRFAPHVAAGLQASRGSGRHEAFPAVVTESVGAALAIAMQSDGVMACTAGSVAQHLRTGALVVVPWQPHWLVANFGILRLRGRALAPAARAMVRCLTEADAAAFAESRALLGGAADWPDESWSLIGHRAAPAMTAPPGVPRP